MAGPRMEPASTRDDATSDAVQPSRRWATLDACITAAVWCSLTGWILSALGCLNRGGYLASVFLGVIALGFWWQSHRSALGRVRRSPCSAWRKRIRRPLPALFAVIFALAALGGTLYPPNNFDALTYRLPQLLHWLDAGHWHWIATSNEHLNITGAGYSWLMAPLLALTQSDRAFFLPNIVAFALLPGLFFSVARGCGVRRRVAWVWMWILPTSYCFAMQAGGIANDLLPATYFLAALALALRCRRSSSVHDAWASILAAALATGVKVVVLPLGLPWLIAIAPAWRLLLRRPLASASIIAVGLAVSFLPTALLNTKNSGVWTGDPNNATKLRIDHPLYGLAGNVLEIVSANLAPPVWPFPSIVNAQFERFQESPIGQTLREHYPRFGMRWYELAAEDGAGIGLGVVILTGVSLAASAANRKTCSKNRANPMGLAICAAGLVAAAAYGAKMGSEAAARLFTAYYPFLLIPLLLPLHETLIRRRWWRVLAWLCAASIVPTLVITPARPLVPAQAVVTSLSEHFPNEVAFRRWSLVYDVFSKRHDHLAPLKAFIPSDAYTVGFVPTGNDLEGSLWRPFGTRRVVEVLQPTRSDPAVQQLKGSVIICSPRGLSGRFQMTVEEFSVAIGGHVVGKGTLAVKAVVGPEPWCVIAVD